MSNKNFKKFAAIVLAGTMMLGSTLTVFATGGAATPSNAGVGEGTGNYEGGEMKYPTLSVTLPTIPEGTYDYIADPNGLIAMTSNEKYQGATFTGTTGIFFLTDKDTKKYTEKSAAMTLTNENAQDIDVTVKLEQKTPGDKLIKYATSAAFETTDKENKLYLAITDDAATNPKVAVLSEKAATITTKVAGVPGNYEAGYNTTTGKYEYTKKTTGLTNWNECSFLMTGAINKNAKWGDDVTFPAIKVTWTYTEHKDSALSSQTISASANAIDVTGATVTGVKLVKTNGTEANCFPGYANFANGKLTVDSSMLRNNVGGKLKITLSTGVTEEVTIQ